MRASLVVALVLGTPPLAGAQTVQRANRPPPALAAEEPNCELYHGTADGNAHSEVQLRLCEAEDGAVFGSRLSVSPQAGWSVRELSGSWDGDRLRGRETRFVESHSTEDWGFCLVDHFELVRSGDRLDGTFTSAECEDRGRFLFQRVVPDVRRPTPVPRREDDTLLGCSAGRSAPLPRPALAAILLVALAPLRGRAQR